MRLKLIYIITFLNIYGVTLSQDIDSSYVNNLISKAAEVEKYNIDSSEILYLKALDLSKKFQFDAVTGKIYWKIAGIRFSKDNNVKNRFKLYFKSLEIFEKIHDTLNLAKLNQSIGVAFMEQRRYDDALKYLQKANAYCISTYFGYTNNAQP